MADLLDITESVDDALTTVVSDVTSVGTPDDHVGLSTRQQDATYPFLAYNVIPRAESGGLGNEDVYVADTHYSNGVIQSIDYATDFTARIPITASAADGDDHTRDTLLRGLRAYMTRVNGAWSTTIHPDVDTASMETQGVDTGGEAQKQADVTWTVTYTRYQTYDSVQPIESVVLDLDADGTDVIDQSTS